MSEKPSDVSVPCPSCGGTVRVSGESGATEWIACPHCEHEWAAETPPRKPKAPPGKPKRKHGRVVRLPSVLLFMVGLLICTWGVAIIVEPDRKWAGGIAFTCAVTLYFTPRRWRWAGFFLMFLWAVWGIQNHTLADFLFGCACTLLGLLLREPTENTEPFEGPEPTAEAKDPIFERRRIREWRRMKRRRIFILLMFYVLIFVPSSLGGRHLKNELIRERQRARDEAPDPFGIRRPGTPQYLLVLHRTPHDGFRSYADFVRELEQENAVDKYRYKTFRIVGKANALSKLNVALDPWNAAPGRMNVEVEVLRMRDRDDNGLTYDTARFNFSDPRGIFDHAEFPRDVKCGEVDGELVIVDGIFSSYLHVFDLCEWRWHGDGNDWEAAIKEAKKGLDVEQLEQNWKVATKPAK